MQPTVRMSAVSFVFPEKSRAASASASQIRGLKHLAGIVTLHGNLGPRTNSANLPTTTHPPDRLGNALRQPDTSQEREVHRVSLSGCVDGVAAVVCFQQLRSRVSFASPRTHTQVRSILPDPGALGIRTPAYTRGPAS